ncbi:hypothetical protein TWF970_007286 [Orbilia oligospora]|uniref:C2H2-type domain-containing protein n=2 Tax=Orbilia oligospora TaxID=2813651 RepID=A0A7C8VHS0_ORBOL|nr:hypothetical protein TWF970_007286 [Orbilia oligospora]
MLASTSPRPAKRPRRSSDSGDMLFCPPRKWAVPAPILLRKLDPTTVITKCLEAVANERLLRGSDLIDRIITDQFLALNELQNRNNTNVKEAKNFICKHIGPILYQVINQYLESFTQDGDVISLSENSQSPIQPKKQKSDGENAPLEVSTATNSKPERKMPPLFTSQMESLGSLGVTAGEAAHTTIDHPSGAGIGGWLAGDSPYPFRKNYPVQSSSINGIPVENIQASGKSQWPHPERSKSDAGVLEDNISMANSSPVKTKSVIARAQSISGKLGGDHQETRSIISNSRKKASQAVRSCTFCYKELPSPSARKEHESIHIFMLCQYKQYQCKQPNCLYRSHRPREILHHMKNRHGRDGRSRGTSLSELLIDHGPLSDERMTALRQQYHMERSEGVNLTTANFSFATPSIKTTDRDLQTDRDELASQHNTIISMDYSYTGNTAIQPHMPTHISSSLFAGLGSAYDDSNSLIMRGELDQASQVDYAMNEFIPYRNSIGQFPPNSFLPQGPQLVGVGAVHAGSSLTNIPSTIDVDEDAQGENDLEWSENLVVNTMKGG